MKRRTFLQSLAAICLAPKLLEQLAPEPPSTSGLNDIVADGTSLWGISTESYPTWGAAVTAGGPLTMEMIRKAQERIWNEPIREYSLTPWIDQ